MLKYDDPRRAWAFFRPRSSFNCFNWKQRAIDRDFVVKLLPRIAAPVRNEFWDCILPEYTPALVCLQANARTADGTSDKARSSTYRHYFRPLFGPPTVGPPVLQCLTSGGHDRNKDIPHTVPRYVQEKLEGKRVRSGIHSRT